MNSETQEQKEEGARSFSVTLQKMADGEAHQEASEKLHELLKACSEEAKRTNGNASGELGLKLKVSVDPRGTATIGWAISAKIPEPKRPKATMWVTPGGNLTAEHPRQPGLPFRDVSAPVNATDVKPSETEARSI